MGVIVGCVVVVWLGGLANVIAANIGWPSLKQMAAASIDQLTIGQSLFYFGTMAGRLIVAGGLGYLVAGFTSYGLWDGSAAAYRTLRPLLVASAACKEEDPETSDLSLHLATAMKVVRRASRGAIRPPSPLAGEKPSGSTRR